MIVKIAQCVAGLNKRKPGGRCDITLSGTRKLAKKPHTLWAMSNRHMWWGNMQLGRLIWRLSLFSVFFIKVQTISLFIIFFFLFQKCLFYTLCTFYYLCKLCLYEILRSSLSLSVNELAFISYVGFVILFFVCLLVCCFWYAAYFWLWSERYEHSPPPKFTLAL